MTTSKLTVVSKLPASLKESAIVVGVVDTEKGPALAGSGVPTSPVTKDALANINLKGLGASAKLESIARTQLQDGTIVGLVGVGSGSLSPDDARGIGGAIARHFGEFSKVILDLPLASANAVAAAIEGASIGNYAFETYKGKPKGLQLKEIVALTSKKVAPAELERIAVLTEAVHTTRDLVNTPPNELFPAAMAAHVSKNVKTLPLKVTIWDEKKLAADKIVGIAAVGQGSSRGPRMVKIEYAPRGAKASLALVGKGITFDSGGLTLKPGPSMLGMKHDMAGAATVYQSIAAIARLGLNVKVSAYLCLAENLPSGTASRPNDVIRYRNGKTVEITNTDAEGRLVLADGLISASMENPDLIVDVATLTGAATIALGNRLTGVMGVGNAVDKIQSAASAAGELVWHMPLPTELRKIIDSDVADMMNSKLGNPAGGMLVGGLFLKEFVGNRPAKKGEKAEQIDWAHLDIANTADNDVAPYSYNGRGATGVILRTLVTLAEHMAK